MSFEAEVKSLVDVICEGVFIIDVEFFVHEDAEVESVVEVVPDEDHAADLNVDCEAAHVKHSVYLLLDLHEHVVGVLLYRLLTLLLTHRVRQLQLIQIQV